MCFLRSGISRYNKLDIANLYNASGCNDSVTHRELSVRGFQFFSFWFSVFAGWVLRLVDLNSVLSGLHTDEEMASVIRPTLGWRTSVVLLPTPRAARLEKLPGEP
jgi:hypothetical protein